LIECLEGAGTTNKGVVTFNEVIQRMASNMPVDQPIHQIVEGIGYVTGYAFVTPSIGREEFIKDTLKRCSLTNLDIFSLRNAAKNIETITRFKDAYNQNLQYIKDCREKIETEVVKLSEPAERWIENQINNNEDNQTKLNNIHHILMQTVPQLGLFLYSYDKFAKIDPFRDCLLRKLILTINNKETQTTEDFIQGCRTCVDQYYTKKTDSKSGEKTGSEISQTSRAKVDLGGHK
jgi:hypothetical protein